MNPNHITRLASAFKSGGAITMGARISRNVFAYGYTINDIEKYIRETYTPLGIIVKGSGDEFESLIIGPKFDHLTYFTFDVYLRYQATVSVDTTDPTENNVKLCLPGYYLAHNIPAPSAPTDDQMLTATDEMMKPSHIDPRSDTLASNVSGVYTLPRWQMYTFFFFAALAIYISVVRPSLTVIMSQWGPTLVSSLFDGPEDTANTPNVRISV